MNLFKIFNSKKVDKQISGAGSHIPNYVGLGDVSANWLSVESFNDCARLAQTVPELAATIGYISFKAADIDFKVMKLNAAGEPKKELTNHPLIDILTQPNYYQRYKEFIEQSLQYQMIFGVNPITLTTSLFADAKVSYELWLSKLNGIFNLPATLTEIYYKNINNTNVFYSKNISEIIDYYLFDRSIKFLANETVLLNESTINWSNGQWILGTSKIKAIREPLSNLYSAYESRNVIMNKRGALGVISPGSDAAGSFPFDGETKKELQSQLQDYGLKNSKYQFILSSKPINYQAFNVSIKDMELLQGHTIDKMAVLDAYNLPKDVFNFGQGATYENQKEAEKRAYKDAVKPRITPLFAALNKLLKTKENGLLIVPDFSKVESLMPDKVLEYKLNTELTTIILTLNEKIKLGNISTKEAKEILVKIWNVSENLANNVILEQTPVPVTQPEQTI